MSFKSLRAYLKVHLGTILLMTSKNASKMLETSLKVLSKQWNNSERTQDKV